MDRAIIDSNNQTIIPGSDFLQLRPERAQNAPLSDWLVAQLRGAISDGRLAVGTRLPATRVLATELRVSRGVITEAYQRLVEEGAVVGRGRAGTVVVGAPAIAPARAPGAGATPSSAPDAAAGGGPGPETGAALFLRPAAADIFEKARAVPAHIDLSPGVPDLGAFPRTAWLRAERHVLSELPAFALGYGDPAGAWPLRAAVANWLARTRGIQVPPAAVLVVAGVAQALSLLAQVLVQDGINAVAFEDPGSLGARQQLEYWQLGTVPVAVDAGGLRVGWC